MQLAKGEKSHRVLLLDSMDYSTISRFSQKYKIPELGKSTTAVEKNEDQKNPPRKKNIF